MNISRAHILMLAIISVFTGIIAPGVSYDNSSLPYAMTNMQYISYCILICSTILFLISSFRLRKMSLFFSGILILLLISLAIMTISGLVKNFGGAVMQSFSWGWIFLLVGLFFLIFALIKEDKEKITEISTFFEKMIGIAGFFMLSVLTAFIIFVAETNSNKQSNTISSNIEKIFETKEITKINGATISSGFDKIENISFTRAKNNLSFITEKNTEKFFYPDKINISNSGTILNTINLNNKNYILYENGEVFEKNNFLGTSPQKSIKDFIIIKKSDKNILITENGEKNLDFSIENIDDFEKIFYQKSTDNLYSRQKTENGYAIFKNSEKISEEYFGILRFLVSDDEVLTLITENENNEKFIVRNNSVIHKINSSYVSGSLKINNSNSLYVIKNSDDGSYSIVVNGITSDRKLDEIREIFLEKNSSGYSYFGKPQGESHYCFFTRYKGNLCGLTGYMNPQFEADGIGVVFAGLRSGKWSIYRNVTEFIKNINYQKTENFFSDYFFFDITNPRYFLIISKNGEFYTFNKMGKKLEKNWLDFDVDSINFGYDGQVLLTAQDENKEWKIVEMK